MRKPDFFVVGASRSGTTSLYYYLIQHPSVAVPVKGPSFFSDFGSPSYDNIESYLRLYSECPQGCVAGDMSTSYLPSRHAARRIHEFQPQAKILIILRNPIERAWSLYWLKRRGMREGLSFEEAIAAEEWRIEEGWTFGFHYVTSGFYADQVRRFLDAFGKDLVRIHLFEDLTSSRRAFCGSVFQFLGVEDFPIRIEGVHNPSGPPRNRFLARILSQPFPGRRRLTRSFPRKIRQLRLRAVERNVGQRPEMSHDTRALLVEQFREDVERLQAILDRDLGHWLAVP